MMPQAAPPLRNRAPEHRAVSGIGPYQREQALPQIRTVNAQADALPASGGCRL
jgi:hypothetical protein